MKKSSSPEGSSSEEVSLGGAVVGPGGMADESEDVAEVAVDTAEADDVAVEVSVGIDEASEVVAEDSVAVVEEPVPSSAIVAIPASELCASAAADHTGRIMPVSGSYAKTWLLCASPAESPVQLSTVIAEGAEGLGSYVAQYDLSCALSASKTGICKKTFRNESGVAKLSTVAFDGAMLGLAADVELSGAEEPVGVGAPTGGEGVGRAGPPLGTGTRYI